MDWSFLIEGKEALQVTTDSRKVTPGCIFVALKGEHFDGNDFVEQAKADGAAYIISGENALAQLQDLARAWRRELHIPVIAITGTNGKTTTKELSAAVLSKRYKVCYTQGNLNNQLGVPLTLLSITRAHEVAIIEMGASHPGDIKELVEIAEPDYGLIMETLERKGAYREYKPDLVLYDVLGDVVCGGFAMPMRKGYADAVCIVTSGENMSIHAAAGIALAVRNFQSRGYARLGGFILNRRNVPDEEEKVRSLAADFETEILGDLPWSPEIQEAERQNTTVLTAFPDSGIAAAFRNLGSDLLQRGGDWSRC